MSPHIAFAVKKNNCPESSNEQYKEQTQTVQVKNQVYPQRAHPGIGEGKRLGCRHLTPVGIEITCQSCYQQGDEVGNDSGGSLEKK